MDQQPKIPTLKDAQKPQVKIKGLGAGLTLIDRLKQFKKKDLAFILAGLGTLFMAPLAEHFMMAPESGDSSLKQGWGGGSGSGSNIFGNGSSPYENGNNSIAQGGAIGGAGDIITPLNVRDPSALVMGPGQSQQPPAGSAAPAVAPPTTTAPSRSEGDYKDALAGAASRAASAAVKRSPLPVPKVALGGSGLRGLGVAGGGSSAQSGGLGPINSGNLGSAGTGGGGLNLVRSSPNFRGAAGPRGPNSPSGLDSTKKAGANAGDAFSRTGSALGGLTSAASEQIPTGGTNTGGSGAGGAAANADKAGGGNGPDGTKSTGESLAFIEAKERMMENLKLEFEKRKLGDTDLLLLGIRNDSLKTMASELTKMMAGKVVGMFDPAKAGGANATISCTGGFQGLLSAAPMCGEKPTASGCVQTVNTGGTPGYNWVMGTTTSPCRVEGGKDVAGKPKGETGATDATKGIGVPLGATPGSLNPLCTAIKKTDLPASKESAAKATGTLKAKFDQQVTQLTDTQATIANVLAAQEILSGKDGRPVDGDCGKAAAKFQPVSTGKSVKANVEDIREKIGGADGKGGLVKELTDALNPPTADKVKPLAAVKKKIFDLTKQWNETDLALKDVDKALTDNALFPLTAPEPFDNAAVQGKKGDFAQAHKDTKELSDNLRIYLNNLKPAVDGISASGELVQGGKAPDGSTKFIVETSVKYDDAIEKAKGATVKEEPAPTDGTPPKDVPLMTAAEVVPKPAGTSVAPTGTPAPNSNAFVEGVKAADDVADKANTDLVALLPKLEGTDAQKKEAKTALLKTDAGSISKNVADATKTQIDILTGIGQAANNSTKPAAK